MRFEIPRLGGLRIDQDTTHTDPTPAGIDVWLVADDIIEVGEVVVHDIAAGDTSGEKVITGTAALGARAVGVYTGKGGTGTDYAAKTGTGQRGNVPDGNPKQALPGDPVQIRVYGQALALVTAESTDLATPGEPLVLTGTAGNLDEGGGAIATTGGPYPYTLLDTAGTTAPDLMPVFVKCLGGATT